MGTALSVSCADSSPTGGAKHRKVHLFDIDVAGGQRFMESDTLSPGDQITTFDTEFGPMGLCICFDLRFEELSRCMCLRGCQAILVPAAFNMSSDAAHGKRLFRLRLEVSRVLSRSCAPARDEQGSYVSYGNSIAVDPWGTVQIGRAACRERV